MKKDISQQRWVKKTPHTTFFMNRLGGSDTFLVASVHGASVDAGKVAKEIYATIAEALLAYDLEIVQERLFGSLTSHSDVMKARGEVFVCRGMSSNVPVTYVEGRPTWGEGLAGVLVRAVRRSSVDEHQIFCADSLPRYGGRRWVRNGVQYLVLQNLNGLLGNVDGAGSGLGGSGSDEVRNLLELADRLLREHGFSCRNVARTWFYLADILAWYPQFNEVRNASYEKFGLMPRAGDARLLLPASTGIEGEGFWGGAATLDLLAVKSMNENQVCVEQLHSNGQCDAFAYGSAFSRGACVREPGLRTIYVSGTASIDEEGRSVHIRDLRGQITTTLEKIEALLAPEKAGLKDFVAATVFLKRGEDAAVFWEMMGDRGLSEFPAVCVVADVCREELLIEIDGDVLV